MSNLETETVVKNGADAPVKDNSILGQLETALVKIIDDRIQAALEKIEMLDADEIKDLVCTEVKYELETQEVPDIYGVRDMIGEEIDNIDWNDRVSESGALDGIVTEDTLESTLDEHRDGGEYVTQQELDDALGELSISRG